ncbi:MAG TPA: branched-chain amino acid ABC transporter substrate-binding protein, partial [Paracoccus sp. (in: a-proteobacteria)]|nr:branched-chain amino acid ABC transporter substrate-binding protein [Paracoccus sp. (in: a-proteobacteria)]
MRALIPALILSLALPAAAQQPPPAPAPQAPAAQMVRAAVLRVDHPGLPPISRLQLPPGDLGFAGARLATLDNDTTGRFMGQDFEAVEVTA